jgi:hypothetical protein
MEDSLVWAPDKGQDVQKNLANVSLDSKARMWEKLLWKK